MLAVGAGLAEPAEVVAAVAAGVVGTAVVVVVGVPDAGALVVAGEAGNVVTGVGSGGNGLDKTLAINSFRPASDWLWRYLYQVLKPSIQSFFCA